MVQLLDVGKGFDSKPGVERGNIDGITRIGFTSEFNMKCTGMYMCMILKEQARGGLPAQQLKTKRVVASFVQQVCM